jgi:protein-S-isoprenylcysteine O-methyltransferase Ste14
MLKLIFSFYLTVGIPLIYFLNLVVIYFYPQEFELATLGIVAGLLCSILGIFLWLMSYYYLGSSFAVLPKKQPRVKKGVYQYFPHPMYLGIFLTFFGLGLANRSTKGLIVTLCLLLPLLLIRALFEDRKLKTTL